MKFALLAEGVYGSREAVISATREEVEFLRRMALHVPRKRARLCAHHDAADPVQEMLIAMARETYVAPHAHNRKTESFHVISGEADLVMFDERGRISGLLELGDLASGRTFYFRIAEPFFHTVIIHTEFLIIHETTTGPFTPGDACPAAWAPPESNREDAAAYMDALRRRVSAIKAAGAASET